MSEWKKVKLGEVCEISAGGDRPQIFSNHRTDKCRIPIYSNGIDNEGLYGFTDTPKNNGNAITITGRGANAGTVFYRKDPFLSIIRLLTLTPNSEIINAKYLFYLLKNKTFLSTGSAQPQITVPNISQFEIEFNPDIETQHRIATILSRYDSLIENYQKQIKLLEEAAQRLYKEWFVDLRFPGHENTKIVDGVPEGWEKKSITDVLEIKYGKDHKLLKEGTIPVYGTGGIMRYVEKSLFTGESVLIPRKGSLNNIMLVGGTFWTIDTMFYSIPKENNVAKIVYFYLKGVDMYSFNIGAAVPSMTVNILSGMKLLVPNEDVKNKFETIASKYFIRMHALQSQLRLLTEARDRLLPKLMSGEITV